MQYDTTNISFKEIEIHRTKGSIYEDRNIYRKKFFCHIQLQDTDKNYLVRWIFRFEKL